MCVHHSTPGSGGVYYVRCSIKREPHHYSTLPWSHMLLSPRQIMILEWGITQSWPCAHQTGVALLTHVLHFLLILFLPNKELTARVYCCDGDAGDLLHHSGLKYVERSFSPRTMIKPSTCTLHGRVQGNSTRPGSVTSRNTNQHGWNLPEVPPYSTTLALMLMNLLAALSAKFYPW